MTQHVRTALFAAAAFVGGAASSQWVAASPAAKSPYDLTDQLGRVLVEVEGAYVDPVDRRKLLEGAIQGLVAGLDPHSAYMPPEEYALFRSDTEGRFGGVGVEVDFRDGGIVVIAPIEGSPAERAAVQPGDRILAIDRVPVQGKGFDALVRAMRGEPGTSVVLLLERKGRSGTFELTLKREIIEVPSVNATLMNGSVAYLRVKQFQDGTHDELLTAVGALRGAAGGTFKGIILDLRNNPGGLVDEAAGVADELLDGGVVYSGRHRGRVVDEVRAARGGSLVGPPVVVLVNELSASAAELVAGALQDHGRARVLGAPTFGKGSVQTILDLPGGAGLKVTTMRYYTPKGRAIQARGITPDELVAPLAAQGLPITRESDLEGHLSAEGGGATAGGTATTPSAAPALDGELYLGVARTTPRDPRGSKDRALERAWRVLTGS